MTLTIAYDRDRMGSKYAGPQGMSDAALKDENKARETFFKPYAEFRSKVLDAQALSPIMRKQFQRLLDAMDDEAPTEGYWDDLIAQENGQ